MGFYTDVIKERDRIDRELVINADKSLRNQPGYTAAAEGTAGVFEALNLILDKYGLETSEAFGCRDINEMLDLMLDPLGVIYDTVDLTEESWKNRTEYMLGFLENGRAVALMPAVIGYRYVCPLTGEKGRVTDKIQLQDKAYVIQRPIDISPVNLMTLMIYVLLLFFVRIDNDPTRVLAATSVCAGVNLVLDILFVGPLHLGVKGAAMATCLAYTLGMFVNLTHFISRKNTLKFIQRCLKGRSLRVWRIGLPLAASQLGMTVSTQIFNNTVIRVGSEDYVAVYGVVIQLTMISMAIYEGVGQASQPMLAAAYGAGRWKRIRRVFLYGLRLELIGTVALALFYFLAANPVAGLFSIKEGALMDLALTAIRIYALSLPMTGVNSIIMYYFQAQEKTGRALLISLLYSSVLLIAALMILVALFREKAIWGSYPAAQALALVISLLMLRRNQNERRIHK